MLSTPRPRRGQRGFIMVIALVALVIMTLAALALMRTVSTSATIAGNLAFEQAAATSADRAVEAAIAWLENSNGKASVSGLGTCSPGTTVLACDQKSAGYAATRTDPTSSQTWTTVWNNLMTAGYTAVTLNPAQDSAGNTPAYIIQRMCSIAGDASSTNGCSASPLALDTSSSRKAGSVAPPANAQVYYRITVRVAGPRNTISFIQAMVAL
ncbi:hypothetical protein [uncultured Pseudacidovorax sp.]|uniref:pilus assembly PilX family protein n=1 Tax=uncultured Pseudacidovorax sp. TaxID=679313 RepID=UPI0025EAFE2D|nr:hypothetical protein [uncultured Pseudacidovorax sp.]